MVANDKTHRKKKSLGAITTISDCIGQIQAAVATIDTAGSTSSSAQSSDAGAGGHDRLAATATLFYALMRLNVLIAQTAKDELLPLEALCCQVISTGLQARRLSLSPALRRPITDFYVTMLVKGTTVNLYSVIKDMQALLLSKSLPVLSRVAALEVLGRVFRVRSRQLSGAVVADVMGSVIKQLKSSEPALREAALSAIGAGWSGTGAKPEIFKALKVAMSDKTPEVKAGVATCLMGLIRSYEDLTVVPLESLLTLGLKGLEEPAVAVQLLYAEAVAHFLSVSVAGQALESKVKSIKAARGETEDESAEKESPSGVDKVAAKLKDLGVTSSVSRSRSSVQSYTYEGAMQYLVSLFIKAGNGAPFGQPGIAVVIVAFLRKHRNKLLHEDTMQWLLSVLLSTATRPGAPTVPSWSKDDVTTRTCVSHMIRAGLGSGTQEPIQLSLAKGLVKLMSADSNLNSHQLQLVLVELSNLLRALGAASGAFSEPLQARLVELLRHLSYGVRFEAATTMESVCHAMPHLAPFLLRQTIGGVRAQYEALASLESGAEGNGQDDNDEGTPVVVPATRSSGSGTATPPSRGDTPPMEGVKRHRSAETERRYRICALHGYSNALVMLLKGLRALGMGAPLLLLEDAMAVAKQLVNQQFSPQMRKWATCVRAGWSVLSAILHQGADWSSKYVRVLFTLFGRSMELEANRTGSEASEPSNLMESMLSTVLVFLRECPQVLWTMPGALTATVELLDKTLELFHARFLQNRSAGSATRLALVKAMIMEAYTWLPPGSYPASCDLLFRWSVSTIVDLVSAASTSSASTSISGSGASGAVPAPFNTPSSGANGQSESAVESSLLPDLLREEDSLLDYKSSIRGLCSPSPSSTSSLSSSAAPAVYASGASIAEVDATPDILALYVLSSCQPLEDREKDASIASGPAGAPRAGHGGGGGKRDDPPTPLHAHYWLRPPMPHPSVRVRLLDAAITLFSATFGHQSNDWQAQAVDRILSLLPSSLKETSSAQATGMAMISVLTSEDAQRRREERHGLISRNIVTALLAALRGLPAHTDSRFNVEVAWVSRMREGLFALLGSPLAMTRRGAAEATTLLSVKMGSATGTGPSSIDAVVQSLLDLAMRKEPTSSAAAASAVLKGAVASTSITAVTYRAAGATFALACLRRALGQQVRLSACWTAVQRVLSVDLGQHLRTWGLYSLLLLLKSLSTIGQNFGVVTADTLQTLDTVMDILEAHFLAVWTSPTQGAEYEPGLLVALLRLMNALLPMVMDIQPDSPSINKFRAMWEVLRHNADSRVQLECLQFLELLALYKPKDMLCGGVDFRGTGGSTIEFLRGIISRPHKSRSCLSTALSCIRSIAKHDAGALRRYSIDVLLLATYDAISSSLHWDLAPFWRAVSTPRELDKAYAGHEVIPAEIRATLDVLVGSDTDRPLHYVLAARAVVLGTGLSRNTGAEGGPTTPKRTMVDDEGGTGDADGGDAAAGPATAPLAERLRTAAAEAIGTVMGPWRWQAKVVAVECILQALRAVSEALVARDGVLDLAKARTLAREADEAKAATASAIAVKGQDNAALTALEQNPQLLALFLEDLVAVSCAAAAACVHDSPLPALQEIGIVLLQALVRLFGSVPDPDADPQAVTYNSDPSSECVTYVLEQYTPQITSALTPSLSSKTCPALVGATCDLVLSLLSDTNMLTDPVVVRRLASLMLPSDLDAGSVVVRQGEGDDDLPMTVVLRMHNVRLRAAAELLVLVRMGTLPSPAADALEKVVGRHADALKRHWAAAVADAARLQHGREFWPQLPSRAVTMGGVTYDDACDPSQLSGVYIRSWPAIAAGAACLINTAENETLSDVDRRTCAFIFATVETALQYSAETGNLAPGTAGGQHGSHATDLTNGTASPPRPSFPSQTAGQSPDHRAAMLCLRALSALLRPPFISTDVDAAEPDNQSVLKPKVLVRLLRALAHGPLLRVEAHVEVQRFAATMVRDLLAGTHADGFLQKMMAAEGKEARESETGEESGHQDDGDDADAETDGDLWQAVQEVVLLPLCRAASALFTPAHEPRGDNDAHGSTAVSHSPGPQPLGGVMSEPEADDDRDSDCVTDLQCPLVIECVKSLALLPALVPDDISRHSTLHAFVTVAVRLMRVAAQEAGCPVPLPDATLAEILSGACTVIEACASISISQPLTDAAAVLFEPLTSLSTLPRPAPFALFLSTWLRIVSLLPSPPDLSAASCLSALCMHVPSFPLAARYALLASTRAALQTRSFRHTQELLRCMGPVALTALYEGTVEFTATRQIVEGYYVEAVKIVLLAFGDLSAVAKGKADPAKTDDDEKAGEYEGLERDFLSLSISAFITFIASTNMSLAGVQEYALSATVLRGLVAQALMSLARAAPTSFKAVVQHMSAEARQVLEATLRTAAATEAGQDTTAMRASQQKAALRIDMSQYQA